nr:zincin-like metallopeptidase domain-containing protein [Bradyrhizobium ivorense]
MKKEYAEEVAARIIEQLKQGTAPWQKPWKPGELRLPYNPTTGKEYRGMNTLWLHMQGYGDPRWMTYNQAGEAGAQVRRGSKGTAIVYWKFTEEQKVTDASGKPVLDAEGKPKTITVELERPRSFTAVVFNAEQIDGLAPLEAKPLGAEPERHTRAETILANSGAKIEHVPGDRAFYRPSTDSITMPERAQFPTADGYYATALHELGHWTGHPSRMDRDLAHPFGSEGYAREELRAEIASLMLGERLEIGHDPGQHAAYVGSWIKKLEEDPREIFRAAADAEKIASYVLDFEQEKTMEKENQQAQPPVAALSPAQERALDLLRQSTLTPGVYEPTDGMRREPHVALTAGVVPLMVLGPADDAETNRIGFRLVASAEMARLVRATHPEFDGPLDLHRLEGAQVPWHTAMPALVSKPAGQVEQGGEDGPLIAVMLDPQRGNALAVAMATSNEVLHCIDPDAPQIQAGTDEQRRTLELLRANERPMVPVPPIADVDERVATALRLVRKSDDPEQGREAFNAAVTEAFGDPVPDIRAGALPLDWTGRTMVQQREGPEPWLLYAQNGHGVFEPFEAFHDKRQAQLMSDRLAVIAAYAEDNEHERTADFARIHEDRVRNDPRSSNDQKVAAKEMRKHAEGIAMQNDAELQRVIAEQEQGRAPAPRPRPVWSTRRRPIERPAACTWPCRSRRRTPRRRPHARRDSASSSTARQKPGGHQKVRTCRSSRSGGRMRHVSCRRRHPGASTRTTFASSSVTRSARQASTSTAIRSWTAKSSVFRWWARKAPRRAAPTPATSRASPLAATSRTSRAAR